MDTLRKLISIIVPVFNEENNIGLIHQALTKTLLEIRDRYEYEILFVNDGSRDNSGLVIKDLARIDRRVRYLEFSRNFGKEVATTAGIHHARGHAVMMIDADLQHPPELIPEFIKKWEEGAEVIIGVRSSLRAKRLKKLGSVFFYKIINVIGENIHLTPFATDFSLLDRRVVKEFNRFTERSRMTRGLVNWLGFKRDFVYFDAPERADGKPGYGGWRLIGLAMNTFVAHSLFPLKLAGYLGVFIVLISGVLGFYILLGKYFFHWVFALSFSGPAQLAILIIFLVGIILSCLGLIALYIGGIHSEILNRPIYVIREKHNFE